MKPSSNIMLSASGLQQSAIAAVAKLVAQEDKLSL